MTPSLHRAKLRGERFFCVELSFVTRSLAKTNSKEADYNYYMTLSGGGCVRNARWSYGFFLLCPLILSRSCALALFIVPSSVPLLKVTSGYNTQFPYRLCPYRARVIGDLCSTFHLLK